MTDMMYEQEGKSLTANMVWHALLQDEQNSNLQDSAIPGQNRWVHVPIVHGEMHPEHLTVEVEKEVEVTIRLHRVTYEGAATQMGTSESCL